MLRVKILAGLAVVGACLLGPVGAAYAGGSDSPTPYTVSASGVTLPPGETFQDNGHVNIKTNLGDKGIHFESLNNQPSGQWIGQSFIPWSAFGLDESKVCVTWVQLSQYNEHFGEGGQAPVGAGCGPVIPPVEEPEVPETEVGCWTLPDGGTPENVTWDQPVADCAAPVCEAWQQVDVYPAGTLAALQEDGFLRYGEDHGIVISWTFVQGPECVEVPEEPLPTETVTPAPPAELASAGPEVALVAAAAGALLGTGGYLRLKRRKGAHRGTKH